MTLQIAPLKIPQVKIAIDQLSNKRLAEGAGLSLEVLRPDSENHLTFRILMDFNEIDEAILFERAIEISDEWKNSDQLKDVTRELLNDDDSHVGIIQSFLERHIEFYVAPQGNGSIEFTLSYLGDLKIGRKDLSITKHHHDVRGWLVSKPD